MPIQNYAENAAKVEKRIFENSKITQANKEHLKLFLASYRNVSPARKAIFLNHIIKLLQDTTDIKNQMHDRAFINNLFTKYEKDFSSSYYSTIINVSLRFVRWLNDKGKDKPKGFQDIQNIGKNKCKRKLEPADMITWKDAQNMLKFTNSVQLKAVLMVQLDGGFRPSEFIDLTYGDIEIKGNYALAHCSGKTGQRDVCLYHSVPALQAWLKAHPIKERKAPLWLLETPKNSHKKIKTKDNKYTYAALKKRITSLAAQANIKKPCDFYNLRHSSCTLSKLENINSGLAAQKYGHSVAYYENTYGRLDKDDLIRRFAKAHGNEEAKQKEEEFKTKTCFKCQTVNEAGTDVCIQCGAPLTLSKALSVVEEAATMKEQLIMILDKIATLENLQKAKQLKKSKLTTDK